MSRPGVTFSEVANVAAQLVGQGKNPTIEQIRVELGTGSSTTIAAHLRKWRAAQEGDTLLSLKENIPAELIALVKGLWERLTNEAADKITVIEKTYQETITGLQQEVQKYKNNNQRWQFLYNQWIQEKEKLHSDKLSAENALVVLQKEQADLQNQQVQSLQQLQEKQERIAELHRLHSQVQANLEHYRESVREQRMLEKEQFDQDKLILQNEIKTNKDQFIKSRERALVLQQECHSLQQEIASVKQQHEKFAADRVEFTKNIQRLEKINYETMQGKIYWEDLCQSAQKKLESQTASLIEAQTNVKVLETKLSTSQKDLAEIKDQYKLVSHEKWLLAQEKAQLEGQLTQLTRVERKLKEVK